MINEVTYTLYKKDTKGKIRELTIETNDGYLNQISGIVGGKLVERGKYCKPKNVGRTNETTISEQAIFEANTKMVSKLREGYFKTIHEAENTIVIMPMLAKSFKDHSHQVDWNDCYAQPKFDGQRCLAFVLIDGIKLMSRKNVEIETMPHIQEAINKLNLPVGTILDGELYIHGHSFQENMRLIKKYRKDESEQVSFHCYDIIDEQPFVYRYALICKLFAQQPLTSVIKLTPTHKITNQAQLDHWNSHWIQQGYEGSMVRWGLEHYKVAGRSSHLLKNKVFLDVSIPILDVLPNDADPTHGTPIFNWPGAIYRGLADTLGCGVRGSHEFRKELLTNKHKYIGKMSELRYFEKSDKGVPRFPVFVGFRNDK